MIWHKEYTIEQMNKMCEKTMLEHLDIKIEEVQEDTLIGSMPVDHRTHQPFGILHGGANCVLAESLGSLGANLTLDPEKHHAVGLNISTNHVKAVRNGRVRGEARPIHMGKTTQLWNIKTYNSKGELTSDSQLGLMILPKKV
ncbi:MAG: thioesterase [Halobacteriovoraceae bacterium]|nr:thioesterase [Peredibacter sp.]MBI99898.1 thioesterase [Halobacteriovoraceae bacterium]|tara:strand:+ start:710 stop:1135 length:426 start_codon:yes stop_codon:yes gene_type:complete